MYLFEGSREAPDQPAHNTCPASVLNETGCPLWWIWGARIRDFTTRVAGVRIDPLRIGSCQQVGSHRKDPARRVLHHPQVCTGAGSWGRRPFYEGAKFLRAARSHAFVQKRVDSSKCNRSYRS